MRRTDSPSPAKSDRDLLPTIHVRRGVNFLILIALTALLVLTGLELHRGFSRQVACGRDSSVEHKSTAPMSVTERACVAQLPSCRPAIAPPQEPTVAQLATADVAETFAANSSPSGLKPTMERRIKLVRPSPVADRSSVKLQGMGPAFLSPLYAQWFSEFHKLHPQVEFDYQFIGNVPAVRALLNGTLDFAVTDVPLSDEQLKQAKTSAGAHLNGKPELSLPDGSPKQRVPSVMGNEMPGLNYATIVRSRIKDRE